MRQLPSVAQKQLEKSKTSAKQAPIPTSSRSIHSSTRAPSSMGRNNYPDINISPSNSSTSSESIDQHQIKRSMSPRGTHMQQQQNYAPMPSSSTSPTPPPISNNLRKTRVPTLNRKKSAVGLLSKRKTPHFMTLLSSDDMSMRTDGLVQLSKKLASYPYSPILDLQSIQMDVPNAPPVDGETLKQIVLNQWEENYELLSSWEHVTGLMLKLLTFEEYIPKLILDAHVDESGRRTEADINKQEQAKLGLIRAKLFLQCENPDLIDILFTSLVQYGNFVALPVVTKTSSMKKDITKLPANRRKLTKEFLEWMDELVTPLIGLNEDVDYTQRAYEGVPETYTVNYAENSMNTLSWFESDDNVRQCLAILLPLITTSTAGTMWHAPLVTFMKHVRLLNQRLFETVTATYDDYSVNKICRVLGIHIRIEPPVTITSPVLDDEDIIEEEEEEEEQVVIEDDVEDIAQVKLELPVIDDEGEDELLLVQETMISPPEPMLSLPEPMLSPPEPTPVERTPSPAEFYTPEATPVSVERAISPAEPIISLPEPTISLAEPSPPVVVQTIERVEPTSETIVEPQVAIEEPESGMLKVEQEQEQDERVGLATVSEEVHEPKSKLSMQERNTILDHDIPSYTDIKVVKANENANDYFTSIPIHPTSNADSRDSNSYYMNSNDHLNDLTSDRNHQV